MDDFTVAGKTICSMFLLAGKFGSKHAYDLILICSCTTSSLKEISRFEISELIFKQSTMFALFNLIVEILRFKN